MRKLNGITINGEYLGNSVVINGMFRAICTISPVIMRDFVLIINNIERLEEAVKINNFNCGFDCIDIEFNNSNTKGIASLYFKLVNGEPELTDCKVVIDDEEYGTARERAVKTELPQADDSKQEFVKTESEESELARRQKINEIKSKKLEELRAKKEKLNQLKNKNTTNKSSIPAQSEEPPKTKLEKLLEQKRKIAEAKAKANMKSAENSGVSTDDSTNSQSKMSDKSETNTSVIEKDSDAKDNTVKNVSINEKQKNSSDLTKSDILQSAGAYGDENAESAEEKLNANSDIQNLNENTGDVSSDYNESQSSKFDNLDDIDLENLSEEELAELEAELEAQMAEEEEYSSDSSESAYSNSQGLDRNFAETISQGLINGLTQGLSEGLAQGLSQGLSQGLAQLSNQNLGNSWGNSAGYQNNPNFDSGFNNNSNFNNVSGMQNIPNNNFDTSAGFNFESDGAQSFSSVPLGNVQPQQSGMDYGQIDNRNANYAMEARDSYSYDENFNMDDLSDLYSDFYDENRIEEEDIYSAQETTTQQKVNKGPDTSEIDALKAELEALKAEAGSKKDLMSLDEFLAKQRELEEAKERKRRQKLRIVGSRGRINASALDGGVFVAGNKVYKWGDTKVLDE